MHAYDLYNRFISHRKSQFQGSKNKINTLEHKRTLGDFHPARYYHCLPIASVHVVLFPRGVCNRARSLGFCHRVHFG